MCCKSIEHNRMKRRLPDVQQFPENSLTNFGQMIYNIHELKIILDNTPWNMGGLYNRKDTWWEHRIQQPLGLSILHQRSLLYSTYYCLTEYQTNLAHFYLPSGVKT